MDNFLKNNIIFFCGSMVVAVFSYLYHPILGRMMSVEEFGEVQTLISLFAQLAIIIGAFRIIVVNIVSNQEREANFAEQKLFSGTKETILMLKKIALYFALAMSAIVIILSPWLKSFFNFNSFYPFISLAIILIISVPITFRGAILQGRHNFKALSLNGIIFSSGKLIFAVILVYIGWSSFGAISAIIIAQCLALLHLISKTKHFLDFKKQKIKIDNRIKKELKYGLLILTATLSVTFLYTADIIIIKHYFPSDVAGIYSGMAVVARIIFFITGSIVGVLLPSIKIRDGNGENGKILKKAMVLIMVLGGTVLIVFSLFPEFAINLLIGDRYLDYAHLLPRMGLILFLVSLINLLSNYMLALRNYSLAIVSVAGISAICIISIFRHETLIQIINNFLFGSIFILFLLVLISWKVRKAESYKVESL